MYVRHNVSHKNRNKNSDATQNDPFFYMLIKPWRNAIHKTQNTYVTTFELKHGGIITNKFEKIVFTIDTYTLNAQKTECAIKGSWAQPIAGEPENVVWRFDDLLEC